ncbi:MAG: hypothetical protein IPJ43_13775 [Saprospiraceae bacterium]|nr:hypothetical protein [Saprospiraceae bacterium]
MVEFKVVLFRLEEMKTKGWVQMKCTPSNFVKAGILARVVKESGENPVKS